MTQDLLDFCLKEELGTSKELKCLSVFLKHGNLTKAGSELQLHRSNVRNNIRKLEEKAANRGYSPEYGLDKPISPGFRMKRHSAHYVDGVKRGEWVISEPDKAEALELLKEAVKEIIDPVPPRKRAKTPPKKGISSKILTIYPLADIHFGMSASEYETGVEDWGLEKATEILLSASSGLVQRAEASERAVVANLGDFFHTDNFEARTRRSGHSLDVDTRLPETIRLGTRLLVDIVNKALEKHREVLVINVPGNHDEVGVIGLAAALELHYAKEPRVTVDASCKTFQHLEFGKCLRGFYHGHTAAPTKLEGVMATHWPEAWGRTTDRVIYTGHIHTQKTWELSGCLVESFSTIIPPDAWSSEQGYRARRGLTRITLHKEWGEISREQASIHRIRAEL